MTVSAFKAALRASKFDLGRDPQLAFHPTLPLSLSIDDAGDCLLFDDRESGASMEGEYSIEDLEHVLRTLQGCEAHAQGDVNAFIIKWVECIPGVTAERKKNTEDYLKHIAKAQERARNKRDKLQKELDSLVALADSGNSAAQYNIFVRYKSGELGDLIDASMVRKYLRLAAAEPSNIGKLAQHALRVDGHTPAPMAPSRKS